MEQSEGSPLPLTADANEITVPVHPYEIVSLQVNYASKPPVPQ
jgi:hypothetical protein